MEISRKSPVEDGVGLKGDFYGAYMRLDGVGSTDRTVMVDGVPRRYVETRFSIQRSTICNRYLKRN